MIDFPLASPDSTVDALLALPVDNPTAPILSPTSPSKHSHRASLGRFTKSEIQRLLREAYAMIMEKDRELTLAAKLRNHIIEENDILREKYSDLVEYVKELNIFNEELVHDGDSGILLNTDYELSPPPPPPSRLRSTPRRNNSRYDEEDAIVSLEQMNQDLQQKLDNALNENDDLRKKGDRRIRKLEHEVEQLRLELERACQTVQELEDQNQSLLSRNREEQRSRPSSQQSNRSTSPKTQRQIEQQAEDEVIEILITKITELEKLNDNIYSQKSDLEQQLEAAMYQLEDATMRVKDLEDTARDYNELQNAFERQSMHVAELSQSVEDQRSWIQNIFGQFSPRSVPGTFSPNTSPIGSTIRSPTRSSFLGSSGCSPSPTVRRRGTLLNELESEWFIQTTPAHNISNTIMTPRTIAHSGYMASTPITGRSPLGSFQSPLSPIPFNNDYLRDVFNSDESKELLEESSGDESNEEELPRRGLFGWVGRLVKYLVKTVLKWCRFLFFLSMAVVIAIYRGPDGAAL